MPLESAVDFYQPGFIRGYVYDPQKLSQRWAVGLFHNGHLVGTYYADQTIEAFEDTIDVPFDCGFEFNLNKAVFNDKDLLTISVLNAEHTITEVCMKDFKDWRVAGEGLNAGLVRHASGLTLSGHLNDTVTKHPSYEILAFDGDDLVGRTRLYRWQHIGNPRNANGQRVGFEILVDAKLADGVPRKLRIETSTGMALEGSPVDFIAYPNSMRDMWLDADGRRKTRTADMALDRILENSMPMTAYAELYPELLSKSLSNKEIERFGFDGSYWELPDSDWTLVFSAAVTPRKNIQTLLPSRPEGIVYFDLGVQKGRDVWPLLFPAFDQERQLEQGYAALCFAAPSYLVARAMSQRPRSPLEVFLEIQDQLGSEDIQHIPHPAGLLNEEELRLSRGLHETVLRDYLPKFAPNAQLLSNTETLFPAVQIKRPITSNQVSVIIPTKDQGEMLTECIESLRSSNPEFDLDIIVVDNRSEEEESAQIFNDLEDTGVTIFEYDDGFNFSQINNLACEFAKHERVCFLNNDVLFPEQGVLAELSSRLEDPTIGAVGPLMVRASDIIQHAGVALGPSNGALHSFEDRMRGDPGYTELLKVAHECSAVTGAMMLTRKSLFERLGGFEETLFAVNFNDVDYCLRLREHGYRVVFTPHCYVQHFESVSRGKEHASPSGNRMRREVDNLRLRWRDVILNDPFTHPLLSTDTLPYRALCTRHRAPAPRKSTIKASAIVPNWI